MIGLWRLWRAHRKLRRFIRQGNDAYRQGHR